MPVGAPLASVSKISLVCRAAIACLGAMYEKLGRMTGRSYEESVQILIKALKNAEVSSLGLGRAPAAREAGMCDASSK